MRKFLFVFLLASASAAQAICTSTTINQATAQQIRLQMTQAAISTMLGCDPIELPAPAGAAESTLLAWSIIDGAYRKQISVNFDMAGGGATHASYREIPLQTQAGGGGNNDRNLIALALLFAASNNAARSTIGGGLGVCTPSTINPGAVQRVRPYMTPAAVSAVLGCAPTEIGPVWIWGIPLMDKLSSKIQVAVVFDAEGAVTAQYQVLAPGVPPICNGALRVEPPTQIGNWVPGACL